MSTPRPLPTSQPGSAAGDRKRPRSPSTSPSATPGGRRAGGSVPCGAPLEKPLSMTSNFEIIRKVGSAYVDKTAYAWKVAHNREWQRQHLLFVRPRRFGKSMFLRTLKAYFEGKKDLFAGLEAARLEETKPAEDRWAQHPVIYLDLGTVSGASVEEMKSSLRKVLEETADTLSVEFDEKDPDVAGQFRRIIFQVAKKCRKEKRPLPVVLIDEYHAPAQKFPKDAEKREAMFTAYRDFFGVLKAQEEHLHAAFITGILRAEIGGSSGANHVLDVTYDPALSGACGFTLEEIRTNFSSRMEEMAAKRCCAADSSTAREECWKRLTAEQQNAEKEKVVKEMKELYNGYHFSVDCETSCYNPFGLVSAFMNKEFDHYWAQSFDGYSSELIQSLSDAERQEVQEVERQAWCTKGVLTATVLRGDSREDHMAALLQSGYLTIAKADEKILLQLPNGEVKQAFALLCVMAWKRLSEREAKERAEKLLSALREGKVKDIMSIIVSIFHLDPQPSGQCTEEERKTAAEDHRPRNAWREDRFRGYLQVLFWAGGARVIAEHSLSTGRVDLEVEAGKYKYIFELKVKELSTQHTAATALEQANGYVSCPPEPGFTTVTAGIVFSHWTRNVCDWESFDMSTGTKLRMDDEDVKEIEEKN
eukprot:gene1868-biopygen1537